MRKVFSTMIVLTLILYPWVMEGSTNSPLAPPDRSSPWATIRSFNHHMNSGHKALLDARSIWESSPYLLYIPPDARSRLSDALLHFRRASQCLDLTEVPEAIREETGRRSILLLKEILDRVDLFLPEDLPGPRWTVPDTEIQLHRIPSGVNEGRWFFAPESIANLSNYYDRVKKLPYRPGSTVKEGFYEEYLVRPGSFSTHKLINMLPQWGTKVVMGQAVWQWLALVLSLVLALLALAGGWYLTQKAGEGRKEAVAGLLRIIPPVGLSICAALLIMAIEIHINLSGRLFLLLTNGLTALKWIGWSLAIVRSGELLGELIVLSPRIDPRSVDASLVRTLSRLLSILAAMAVLTNGISRLGLPLATVMTGFGVAGLALSLAARPTVENIIGGLTLFADRSIKVGENCTFGNVTGTVINIGLRSTRVKALDHTVVSIPNAELSQMKIVNITRRTDSLMERRISLRHETTDEQLRSILSAMREMLGSHPMVCDDPEPMVRLENFGPSSMEILLFAYVKAIKRAKRLEIEEDILFRVMEIVDHFGSAFAFPSCTTYYTRDPGVGGEGKVR